MIDCGSTCSHKYHPDTPVTLTASPAANSSFVGWSGDCSGKGVCTVTMDKAKRVKATFEGPYTLKVLKTSIRKGSGTVISLAPGINCGTDCQESYLPDTVVVLSAIPDQGTTFEGWMPRTLCPGAGECSLTMDAARTVTARFAGTVKATGDEEAGAAWEE
jgi:hypothetical protein